MTDKMQENLDKKRFPESFAKLNLGDDKGMIFHNQCRTDS